jgi:hypothetical protein
VDGLEIIGLVVAGPLLGAAGAAGLTGRHLRRSNRLSPGVRTATPTAWLWSPRRAAVLHRRLRSACAVAHLALQPEPRSGWRLRRRAPVGVLADVARQLIAQADGLDRQLLVASRLRLVDRVVMLAELEREVRSLQGASRRLHELVLRQQQLATPDAESTQLSLHDRLDAMAAALEELSRQPGSLPPAARVGRPAPPPGRPRWER